MSKAQTAADVALKVAKLVTGSGSAEEIVSVLEEWAKQLHPHPDEIDEEVARNIYAIYDSDHIMPDDLERTAQLIARHTAAKVAKLKERIDVLEEHIYVTEEGHDKALSEAEERGWNRGAEAMRDKSAWTAKYACLVEPDGGSPTEEEANVCDEAEKRIRALPLPPYQKKGE